MDLNTAMLSDSKQGIYPGIDAVTHSQREQARKRYTSRFVFDSQSNTKRLSGVEKRHELEIIGNSPPGKVTGCHSSSRAEPTL